MVVYECTNCHRIMDENNIGIDVNVEATVDAMEGSFAQLYCTLCESTDEFRVLIKK